jgi:hypothetical protein
MDGRAHHVAGAEIDEGQDRSDARRRNHEVAGGIGLAAACEITDQVLAKLRLRGEKIVAADRFIAGVGGTGGIEDGRIGIAVGETGEADKARLEQQSSFDRYRFHIPPHEGRRAHALTSASTLSHHCYLAVVTGITQLLASGRMPAPSVAPTAAAVQG